MTRWRDCACGRPSRSRGASTCPDCRLGRRFQRLIFRSERKGSMAPRTLRQWQLRREKECKP